MVLGLGGHLQSTFPLQADTNSDRLFTVNDVRVGGSKYGIISLRGLTLPTLRVHMHENLYFTNRKVLCSSLWPCSPLWIEGLCSGWPNAD